MKKRNSLLILSFLILSSCADYKYKTYSSEVVAQETQDVFSEKPFCEVLPYDYVLNAEIDSFEIYSSTGFNVAMGFAAGAILGEFDLSFQFEKGQMTSNMQLIDSKTQNELGSALGSATFRKTDLKGSISPKISMLDLFKIGGSYYKKTPFYELSKKTLESSYKALIQKVIKNERPWETPITGLNAEQDYAQISVGTMSGISVGDEFEIYNMEYDYKGKIPCTGNYSRRAVPNRPIGVAKVESNIDLDYFSSWVKITTYTEFQNQKITPELGSILVYKKKNDKDPKIKTLKRSIRVGSLKAMNLKTVDSSTAVNLENLLLQQVKEASEQKYYFQ